MKNFKTILTLLLLWIIMPDAIGQFDAEAARARMWGSNDPDFAITTIPEKWKNESAVILCKSVHSDYKKQALAARVNYDYYMRQRIMVLDKSAVDAYTQISFDSPGSKQFSREGFFLGIKVIKPDGAEREINIEEAVRMQQNGSGAGYNKLAIPGLETGDIIDYYMVWRQTAVAGKSFGGARYEFDPTFAVLSQEYPVVKGKISFMPERRCYINIGAVNGAPMPVEKAIGKDIVYEITYSNLERIKTELWTYPYRQEPTIKYQVVMSATPYLPYERYFLGEAEVMKTTVSEQELSRLISIINSKELSQQNELARELKKFVKRKRISNHDHRLIADMYYFMRHQLYFRSKTIYGFTYENKYFYDRFDVIQAYSAALQEQKIAHTVFLTVPPAIGTLSEVILLDELTPGIRIEQKGKSLFLLNPDIHQTFGKLPYTLENSPAVSMFISSEGSYGEFTYDTLPALTPADNFEYDSIYVSIDPANMDSLKVKVNFNLSGGPKEMFSALMLLPADIITDEYKYYKDIEKLNNAELIQNKKDLERLEAKNIKHAAFRKENIQAWLAEHYQLQGIKVNDVSIEQAGRFADTAMLVFNIEATLPGVVSATGNYLLVDAGRLIGSNIDLTPEEKNRQQDIYMPGPRSVKWKVIMDLPKNYVIKKSDNLQYEVNNQTGGFRSHAIQAGSRVTIVASKWYNHGYEPLENWPEMLQFLEAANDFVQQKLVLEPEE
jgi:hypothetical protein